ncbi:Y-family DNA polymerase [Aquincola tertiaricarbonis]|uniref:Y-family DNA polymerase n=1 Tax=Aquincola tertiaricarbonis TaxID=391953 RepID=UPI00287385A0|nr:hypothetical protein [Aquincola tertiaricarbonis]
MSDRMTQVIGRHAARQELYSIDECILDFEDVRGHLVAIGCRLRDEVLQVTGIPCCVVRGRPRRLRSWPTTSPRLQSGSQAPTRSNWRRSVI